MEAQHTTACVMTQTPKLQTCAEKVIVYLQLQEQGRSSEGEAASAGNPPHAAARSRRQAFAPRCSPGMLRDLRGENSDAQSETTKGETITGDCAGVTNTCYQTVQR